MSRLINRKVLTSCDSNKQPRVFVLGKQPVSVSRILEVWKDTGLWWEGESEKTFFRVESRERSLFELYMDNTTREWYLYRIYD